MLTRFFSRVYSWVHYRVYSRGVSSFFFKRFRQGFSQGFIESFFEGQIEGLIPRFIERFVQVFNQGFIINITSVYIRRIINFWWRYGNFEDFLTQIEKVEGGLDKFSSGYKQFGPQVHYLYIIYIGWNTITNYPCEDSHCTLYQICFHGLSRYLQLQNKYYFFNQTINCNQGLRLKSSHLSVVPQYNQRCSLFKVNVPSVGCITWLEWAPAAHSLHLYGEFNEWNRTSHPFKKLDFGR